MSSVRLEILVTGQVQGVGFRPHVYRVAKELNLTGFVQNIASGVLITVQGILAHRFLSYLIADLPSLAKVEATKVNTLALQPYESTFSIMPSKSGINRTLISPDVSVCDACLQELVDPSSRYFQYPFISCTQCGPRLTITHELPYDREHTAMNVFPLCEACLQEYEDPAQRRFHHQTSTCAQCGPQLSLSIEGCQAAITAGEIIAIKAVGGYQLICDATNETAIVKLRSRKNRAAKPFALMAADIPTVHRIAYLNADEQEVLTSQARPIVLLRKRDGILPELIAPGLSHLGIMLPNSPLHFLLCNATLPILIVTSANVRW